MFLVDHPRDRPDDKRIAPPGHATMTMQAAPCAISPDNMRLQAKRVGDDLVQHYGKRNFYSEKQVRAANERCRIGPDFACWSFSMFSTHSDFDRMHAGTGETCDYVSMKQQMLASVSEGDSSSWFDFDFDLSWLDFPDIDFSIFDFFDL